MRPLGIITGTENERAGLEEYDTLKKKRRKLSEKEQNRKDDLWLMKLKLNVRQGFLAIGAIGLVISVTGESAPISVATKAVQVPTAPSPPPTPRITHMDDLPADVIAERRTLKDQWVQDLELIAELSDMSEVRSVLKFVKENGLLCIPRKEGMQFVDKGKGPKNFPLIIFKDEDGDINEGYKSFVERKNVAALFRSNIRALFLKKTDDFSPFMRGFVFAHESFHALKYTENPTGPLNGVAYAANEETAHSFGSNILEAAGGEPYQYVLTDEKLRLSAVLAGEGKVAFMHGAHKQGGILQ